MKAMILAAGRGSRMREYCADFPKPLMPIGNTTLIENMLCQLAKAGIEEVIINVSYLAQKIIDALGDGDRYGVRIQYSIEKERALETGGGVKKALPLLGEAPFLVVSGDIWTQYPFATLTNKKIDGAHLVLVNNPTFHPAGDFCLHSGRVDLINGERFTFGNIAILHPSLFATCDQAIFPLSIVLKEAINKGLVTGELYQGVWHNVGTPDELEILINSR